MEAPYIFPNISVALLMGLLPRELTPRCAAAISPNRLHHLLALRDQACKVFPAHEIPRARAASLQDRSIWPVVLALCTDCRAAEACDSLTMLRCVVYMVYLSCPVEAAEGILTEGMAARQASRTQSARLAILTKSAWFVAAQIQSE